MSHAIMVEVSDTLFEQLMRTAELTQRPMGRLVAHSLAQTITPLMEDIPAEYQRDVYPLLEMSEDELLTQTAAVFSTRDWVEYESLLTAKKERALTDDEQERLDQLRRQADILMLRKGYAALLLKRRGYRQPTLEELPKVSH